MASEISIKGMVCERCIAVIKEGITHLGYNVTNISLGKLSLFPELTQDETTKIEEFLRMNGFELIPNRHVRVVSRVKELANKVFTENPRPSAHGKFSSLLSRELHMNYESISRLFSHLEGTTIEQYIIGKRIEKVKELLVYTEFRLTEIAYITGFSSINHLSRQFKQLTGLSPSHFKAVKKMKKVLSANAPPTEA